MYKDCFFGVFLHESAHTAAKRRTNLSTNSGKGTDWQQIWHTYIHVQIHLGMDIIQQTNCPSRHKGGFRGSKIQNLGKLTHTAGPIGTKFGTRLRIRLGMDIG